VNRYIYGVKSLVSYPFQLQYVRAYIYMSTYSFQDRNSETRDEFFLTVLPDTEACDARTLCSDQERIFAQAVYDCTIYFEGMDVCKVTEKYSNILEEVENKNRIS
jgi:hypothetical protein